MTEGLICWDSSVLISLLKGDEEEPETIQEVQSVVESLKQGNYSLIVSVLVYVEVLKKTMPTDAERKFKEFIQNRKQVQLIAVDIRVAEKAQSIRNRTNIRTPDAIHLATAIVGRSKLFHTFDKGLLKFNGKNEVDGISITPCTIPGKLF